MTIERQVYAVAVASLVVCKAGDAPRARFWGASGHRMTARAAAAVLPQEMPSFFQDGAAQLAYLNPEPDRWRSRVERDLDAALEGATAPEHFLDYELIPPASRVSALAAPDRIAFADTLRAHGVSVATAGILPFAILEMTQRLRVAFREWRAAPNARTRAWIEARILNDAGLLGHYVADASNPAHTTVHYNGWVGPNPNGYATDDRFHSRFESAFVQARVRQSDVSSRVGTTATTLPSLRPAIIAYFLRSHAEVTRLYALDKARAFSADNDSAEHVAFAATRLAAGATMLRDLWWTAWVTSAPP
jgi:hypothetical protein